MGPGWERESGQRRWVERARQVRGLAVLAVLVLVFAVVRFGVERVFGVGWWRVW